MMNTGQEKEKTVSAIIPAYNEEATIASVVNVVASHRLIAEVIVVDDGSTDKTASVLVNTKARVIKLGENHGKAYAMSEGVEAASCDTIFFLDADVRKLTHAMIDEIILPVVNSSYDMFVGIRGRKMGGASELLSSLPLLGGERALKKKWWYVIPSSYKKDFQIEAAMNYFIKQHGGKVGHKVIPKLTHVVKEKKYGLFFGLSQRIRMIKDLSIAAIRLYFFKH